MLEMIEETLEESAARSKASAETLMEMGLWRDAVFSLWLCLRKRLQAEYSKFARSPGEYSELHQLAYDLYEKSGDDGYLTLAKKLMLVDGYGDLHAPKSDGSMRAVGPEHYELLARNLPILEGLR